MIRSKRHTVRTPSDAYDFVPLSHESDGMLGQPATQHLSTIPDIAARSGDGHWDVFVRNALWRLGVAMCKGDANLHASRHEKLQLPEFQPGGAVW